MALTKHEGDMLARICGAGGVPEKVANGVERIKFFANRLDLASLDPAFLVLAAVVSGLNLTPPTVESEAKDIQVPAKSGKGKD